MRPTVYEFKRKLTSKLSLSILGLFVILVVILSFSSVHSPYSGLYVPPSNTDFGLVTGYQHSGNSYNLFNYVYNGYGVPQKGVTFSVSFQNGTLTETTDSYGFANFTLITDSANVSEKATESLPSSLQMHIQPSNQLKISLDPSMRSSLIAQTNFATSGPTFYYNYPGYQANYSINSVINPYNLRSAEVQILYLGNESASPRVSIYYTPTTAIFAISAQESQKNPIFVSNISNFGVAIVKITPQRSTYSQSYGNYNVMLTNSSGEVEASSTLNLVYVPNLISEYRDLFNIMGKYLQPIVPLMAVILGYLSYGRERTLGILDSVIVKPTSRFRVFVSRYLANSLLLIVMISLSVVFMNLYTFLRYGMLLPLNINEILIFTFSVEALSFLGLVFLLSNGIRSHATLLSVSIALFVVFDLIWSETYSLFSTPNTLFYNFFSPGGIFYAVKFTVENTVLRSPGLLIYTLPLHLNTSLAFSTIWMILPLVLTIWLLRREE